VKPVLQTQFHVPAQEDRDRGGDPAVLGNCMAAAIASVLELPLEDVPNFVAFPDWWGQLERFLGERGLGAVDLPYGGSKDVALTMAHRQVVLLAGRSPRGDYQHVIVAEALWRTEPGGWWFEFLHDPHPDGAMLRGEPEYLLLFTVRDPARAAS
jgi:hypothetical protein